MFANKMFIHQKGQQGWLSLLLFGFAFAICIQVSTFAWTRAKIISWNGKVSNVILPGARDEKGKKDKQEKKEKKGKKGKTETKNQEALNQSGEQDKKRDKPKTKEPSSLSGQTARITPTPSSASTTSKTGSGAAPVNSGASVKTSSVDVTDEKTPTGAIVEAPTGMPKDTSTPVLEKPIGESKDNKDNKDSKDSKEKIDDSADTIRISSNLVTVPVSITDPVTGEPVRSLHAEDFKLDEEGQAQQLQTLGEPGQTPLELILLFDVSGSVYQRLDFQKQAASRFLRQVLKPNDTVSVFLIGMEPRVLVKRTRQFPTVIDTLLQLEPTKEGTAFFDTVAKAAQYLKDEGEQGARRVIVVISDGEDNHSQNYRLNEAKRELQASEAIFYAINPSGSSIRLNQVSMRGQNAMESLAVETGGLAFQPERIEDLDRVFRQIAAELQAQYLLGYYSSNEVNDGKYRRIRIQLPKRPEARIRARQGYYAPKD